MKRQRIQAMYASCALALPATRLWSIPVSAAPKAGCVEPVTAALMAVQSKVVSASPPMTPHGALRFLTLPLDAKKNVDVMRALLPTLMAPPPPREYPVEPIFVVSILPQSPLAGSFAN